MQRVTLQGQDMAGFCAAGIHLRLVLPGRQDAAEHVRYLTIRSFRPVAGRSQAGQIDIDIVRHDGGPVSDWAMAARPGDQVSVIAPVGMPDLPTAGGYFLAADGSGLGAVARYMLALPSGARGTVAVAAAPGIDLARSYLPPTGLTVLQLAPAEFDDRIVAVASRCMAENPPGFVVFAGEFAAARGLRAHVGRTLRLDRTRHGIVSYWRREAKVPVRPTIAMDDSRHGEPRGVLHLQPGG
jgi:NADPH-dependent ferric siderophore reductase